MMRPTAQYTWLDGAHDRRVADRGRPDASRTSGPSRSRGDGPSSPSEGRRSVGRPPASSSSAWPPRARASTRTGSTPASAASSPRRSRPSSPRSSSFASCGATRAAWESRIRAEIVRAAMLLRANTLAKGYSGARPETVELLLECLNRGVTPVVPSRGSVGASGDLAPLAHLALPLVGEGRAIVEGEELSGAEALARVGLEPVRLRGEGRPVAHQRHAVHGSGRRARAGAGPTAGAGPRTSRAPSRSRRSRARARAFSRRSTRCGRSPGSGPRPPTSSGCSRAPRSSRRIAGATRCRTPTRSAARRRCTAPAATCSRTPSGRSQSS